MKGRIEDLGGGTTTVGKSLLLHTQRFSVIGSA